MKVKKTISILLFLFVIFGCGSNKNQKVRVWPAHSHNDYEHERPLFDALDCHFKSVEADVYSVGDSLFMVHSFDQIKPGRTFRQLYLEPLKKTGSRKRWLCLWERRGDYSSCRNKRRRAENISVTG